MCWAWHQAPGARQVLAPLPSQMQDLVHSTRKVLLNYG